jgi:hypothetical protein
VKLLILSSCIFMDISDFGDKSLKSWNCSKASSHIKKLYKDCRTASTLSHQSCLCLDLNRIDSNLMNFKNRLHQKPSRNASKFTNFVDFCFPLSRYSLISLHQPASNLSFWQKQKLFLIHSKFICLEFLRTNKTWNKTQSNKISDLSLSIRKQSNKNSPGFRKLLLKRFCPDFI